MLKLIIFVALVSCCSGQNDKLPEEFQVCHRKDASFNICLARAIEGAIISLEKGNKLFNIPSIDPYHITDIKALHSGGTSNFNLKSNLKNAELTGLSEPKFKRVATKFDKKFALKAEVNAKRLQVFGDYTMDGQILVLPIRGIGKANISLSDISCLVKLRGEYFEKQAETFINLTRFSLKLSPKQSSFNFENIFNGDPVLSATISNFMNENSELVANTLLPGYELKLSEEFKMIANRIFNNVPMKFIFPE